jgi:hypothetical protein
MGGICKDAVEMGSYTMIYIPGFIKIVSAIRMFIGRIYRHTDSTVIA